MDQPTSVVEQSAAGAGILVEIDGMTRLAAHVFRHPDGLVFVDVGWCDPLASFHAFHILAGRVEGVGPWRCGNATLRLLTEDDNEVLEWTSWQAYQAERGANCTREAALQNARQVFSFE